MGHYEDKKSEVLRLLMEAEDASPEDRIAIIRIVKRKVKIHWHPEWNPITTKDLIKEGRDDWA